MPVTTWARSGAVMATLAALSGAGVARRPRLPRNPCRAACRGRAKQRDGSHRMSVKVRVLLSSSHGGSGEGQLITSFGNQTRK